MRNKCIIFVALLMLLCLAANGDVRRRYDNYTVYRIVPGKNDHLAVIKKYEDQTQNFVIDIGSNINVLVSPAEQTKFENDLTEHNIVYKIMERNVQKHLEVEELVERSASNYTWNKYHILEDTYDWLQLMAQKYSQQVETFKAGTTYEKRDIMGIKISFGKKSTKRGIFLEGGMHAREWISPATTTFIANQILTNQDEDVRKTVEQFDWYIVPHANPDGYVYTYTRDRLWRKTRTPYAKNCFGADPNRNWDFHWNEVGTSDNPCSDVYAGPEAHSEIETRSLSKFLKSIKDELFLYISFHSYSQLLLFPYGYTAEHPKHYDDMQQIFTVAVEAISKRYGTKFTGGNTYDAIYPASGNTHDWAYGTLNVNYSFTYELRPSSNNYWPGFVLPANQIIPTGEETFDSVVAMAQEANNLAQKYIL